MKKNIALLLSIVLLLIHSMNVLNFVVAEGEKDEKYLGTNVENIVESENVMAYGIEDELEYVVSDDYFSEENAHDAAGELEILGGGGY